MELPDINLIALANTTATPGSPTGLEALISTTLKIAADEEAQTRVSSKLTGLTRLGFWAAKASSFLDPETAQALLATIVLEAVGKRMEQAQITGGEAGLDRTLTERLLARTHEEVLAKQVQIAAADADPIPPVTFTQADFALPRTSMAAGALSVHGDQPGHAALPQL